jgi:D-beta-D-heptose 7-phosphate kinase/D-beta-D-heptose 1-phosphate adenosyltransferase
MILKANSDEYYKYCKQTRKSGIKIVMFNGCFDFIHIGHVKMIQHIQNYKGCFIICAINSDESVNMQNKTHPLINTVTDRIAMVKQLFNITSLDFITFDTLTPSSIIWHLMPDIIYKGIDYEGKEFPEKFIMDKIGGEIKYYDSGIEMSTTKIIEKVKQAYGIEA